MTGPRDPHKCLGCGGPLEAGALIDRGHLNVEETLRWTPGELEGGPVHALRVPKHEWREPVPVRAARCTACGRLELFANDRSVKFE